jgi:hypothetical protein
MEAIYSSELSVDIQQTARRYIAIRTSRYVVRLQICKTHSGISTITGSCNIAAVGAVVIVVTVYY